MKNKDVLKPYIQALTAFPDSDCLVHFLGEKIEIPATSEIRFSNNATWNKKLKIVQDSIRETGVNPLALAGGFLVWKKDEKSYTSPLFLTPLESKKTPFSSEISLKFSEENWEINPYLDYLFLQEANISLEVQPGSLSEMIVQIEQILAEFSFPCELVHLSGIDLFHPDRFAILRDLRCLDQSEGWQNQVQLFLGEPTPIIREPIVFPTGNILAVDSDQKQILTQIEKEDLVIQGSPGTGKSQILTLILGKILQTSQNALVVSEKKSALHVVQKKLEQLGLSDYLLVLAGKQKRSEWYQQLHRVWENLASTSTERKKTVLPEAEMRLNVLQQRLERLKQKELLSGVSFWEFKEITSKGSWHETPWVDLPITLKEWKNQKKYWLEYFPNETERFLLTAIKPSIWSNYNVFSDDLRYLTKELEKNLRRLHIITLHDFENRLAQQVFLSLYEHSFFLQYPWIQQEKKQLKWKKITQRWNQFILEWETVQRFKSVWKIEPSLLQIENWLNNPPTNFWTRIKQKKQIQAFLHTNIPYTISHLEDWKKYLILENQRKKLLTDYTEFQIQQPEIENAPIQHFISNWYNHSSRLHEISHLSEEMKEELNNNKDLKNCLNTLKNVINYDQKLNLVEFCQQLNSDSFEQLVSKQTLWEKIGSNGLQLLAYAKDLEEAENYVIKSNWIKLEGQFPDLVHWSGAKLLEQIEAIEQAIEREQKATIEEIHALKCRQFHAYHELLRANPAKLNAEQRAKRIQLKKGKAILIKQFSKSRNHLHFRELIQSDARVWIEIICPIWLTTPAEVSKQIPFETNYFDWCLVDEASQIPVPHILGSLQRSKRIVIAGDEQQMPPSSYFNHIQLGHDVLHQAKFHLNSCFLHHHYRSEHSALIAFSNTYFYDKKLLVFPSAKHAQKPLNWHFIENGVYEAGTNHPEAEAIAAWIETNINRVKSLGVVAFSEKQSKLIWSKLSPKTQFLFEQKIEENDFFFRPLEQIQGNECGTLLISLGYGKNPSGKFELRMGPINSSQGAKRLNVLFSRAQQEIHFFSSVKAEDFPPTNNESIDLLKRYVMNLENPTENSKIKFPYNIDPEINGNQITIYQVENQIPNAQALFTFISTLKNRGWKMNFS